MIVAAPSVSTDQDDTLDAFEKACAQAVASIFIDEMTVATAPVKFSPAFESLRSRVNNKRSSGTNRAIHAPRVD